MPGFKRLAGREDQDIISGNGVLFFMFGKQFKLMFSSLLVMFLVVVLRISVNVSLVSDTATSGFGAGASARLR